MFHVEHYAKNGRGFQAQAHSLLLPQGFPVREAFFIFLHKKYPYDFKIEIIGVFR